MIAGVGDGGAMLTHELSDPPFAALIVGAVVVDLAELYPDPHEVVGDVLDRLGIRMAVQDVDASFQIERMFYGCLGCLATEFLIFGDQCV